MFNESRDTPLTFYKHNRAEVEEEFTLTDFGDSLTADVNRTAADRDARTRARAHAPHTVPPQEGRRSIDRCGPHTAATAGLHAGRRQRNAKCTPQAPSGTSRAPRLESNRALSRRSRSQRSIPPPAAGGGSGSGVGLSGDLGCLGLGLPVGVALILLARHLGHQRLQLLLHVPRHVLLLHLLLGR